MLTFFYSFFLFYIFNFKLNYFVFQFSLFSPKLLFFLIIFKFSIISFDAVCKAPPALSHCYSLQHVTIIQTYLFSQPPFNTLYRELFQSVLCLCCRWCCWLLLAAVAFMSWAFGVNSSAGRSISWEMFCQEVLAQT